LIASPSDVLEERDWAVRVIQDWNDLNSAERRLVLLPLRWETHSAPEYGKQPQEVINRQVVDGCDLLIGIFWTRIGSPTGKSESGTLEEIDRVARDGKPVMLYFSKIKQDPGGIDLDQLAKLREFKSKTYPRALVETYSDVVEFRDKLAKQLEIEIRSLVAEESGGSEPSSGSTPVTKIRLLLANSESGNPVGDTVTYETAAISVRDFATVPDYGPPGEPSPAGTLSSFAPSGPNKNYYRETITHMVQRSLLRPIRFWLKNDGQIGARDVYIDLTIQSEDGSVICVHKNYLPKTPPPDTRDYFFSSSEQYSANPEEIFGKAGTSFRSQVEVSALQPQREISPDAKILVGVEKSKTINVTARIYADVLPEPITQNLRIRFDVRALEVQASDLIPELAPEPAKPITGKPRTRAKKAA
jgi:hypothetical protein